MERNLLLFILILFAINARGQNSYYETDTSFTTGVRIIPGKNNSDFFRCQIYSNGKYTEYSPYQVRQYGLEDGTEYFARDIELADSIQRVFMERLVTGKLSLYYFGASPENRFYLEKDSTFFSVIPDNNKNVSNSALPDFLKEISGDCPELGDAVNSVKYNRLYLSRFVESYNNCRTLIIPKARFGIIIGVGARKPVLNKNSSERVLTYFDYNYVSSLAAGVFANIPVMLSDFSVQAELIFNKTNLSYTASTDVIDYKLAGSIQSLKMPVMLRYTHPSTRLKPFINAGPVFDYSKNDLILFQEPINGETPVIAETDYSAYLKKLRIGLSAGGGLEYRLTPKHSLFIELQYDYLATGSAGTFINTSEISLTTGINF